MDDAYLYDFARSGATANNVSRAKCHHKLLTPRRLCIETDFEIHRGHERSGEQILAIRCCKGAKGKFALHHVDRR